MTYFFVFIKELKNMVALYRFTLALAAGYFNF